MPEGHLSPTRRLLTLLAAYSVIMGGYLLVGLTTASGATRQLETALDRAVPLAPAWVLVYAAVYLQALAPACIIRDVRVLDRTVFGYLSIHAVSLCIWMLFPVSIPRTPIVIQDVWTYGLALVRTLDPPTNCFPSLHVSLATMAALVVRRHDPVGGWFLLGTAALITFSTLATEQHWIADGLLGILLALISNRLWLSSLPSSLFQPLPRIWHGVWLGLYVGAVLILMSGWWLGWMPLRLLQTGGSVQ